MSEAFVYTFPKLSLYLFMLTRFYELNLQALLCSRCCTRSSALLSDAAFTHC